MKLFNILHSQKKVKSVEYYLNNDACKKLLEEFIAMDMRKTTSLVLIYEIDGDKKQTYWKCAGIEPAQAILMLDQLHHRIQHEGLPGYD